MGSCNGCKVYGLDNLVAIVDKNKLRKLQGPIQEKFNLYPLEEKWKAFGWHVIEIDGHNVEEILKALDRGRYSKGKPTVIIANTVKAKVYLLQKTCRATTIER